MRYLLLFLQLFLQRLFTLLIITVLLVLLVFSCATAQSTLAGKVTHVRDGDTIDVDGIAIGLNGLSAPERSEPFVREATEFMKRLIYNMDVTCELNRKRSHDRLIGIFYLDGVDISSTIVRAGLARDCPRYRRGRYASDGVMGLGQLGRSYTGSIGCPCILCGG